MKQCFAMRNEMERIVNAVSHCETIEKRIENRRAKNGF